MFACEQYYLKGVFTMSKVISIIQQSGGVAKSTANFNLSHIIADMGIKVLDIENELQSDLMAFYCGRDENLNINVPEKILYKENDEIKTGSAHTINLYKDNPIIDPIEIKNNLHYIGSTKHISPILTKSFEEVVYNFMDNIEKLKKQFDIIFIDCPPTESNLQKAALMASDYALIPTFLEQKSIGGITGTIQLINHLKKIKQRQNLDLNILGIFVAQYSYIKDEKKISSVVLERIYFEKLINLYSEFLLKTRISDSIKIRESETLQMSIVDYAKEDKAAIKVADEYKTLAIEILDRINN